MTQDDVTEYPFGDLPIQADLSTPVTPEPLAEEQEIRLERKPPEGAVRKASKSSGPNAQTFEYVPWVYAADALDRLCGVAGWRLVCTRVREVRRRNAVELVWMGYLIGKGIKPPIATTGYGLFFETGGMGWSDAFQSAESRALTKAAGRLGIFRHQWVKEQEDLTARELKGPPSERRQTRPAPRQPVPSTQGAQQPRMVNPDAQAAVDAASSQMDRAKRTFGSLAREQLGLESLGDVLPRLGLAANGQPRAAWTEWWKPAQAQGLDLDAYARATVAVIAEVVREEQNGESVSGAVAAVNPKARVLEVYEQMKSDASPTTP